MKMRVISNLTTGFKLTMGNPSALPEDSHCSNFQRRRRGIFVEYQIKKIFKPRQGRHLRPMANNSWYLFKNSAGWFPEDAAPMGLGIFGGSSATKMPRLRRCQDGHLPKSPLLVLFPPKGCNIHENVLTIDTTHKHERTNLSAQPARNHGRLALSAAVH
jgi:hypothetical protein